ncbi:MAG: discoidin domain-containing protein [Acidobacteria bacterium]|nr:discoidin domain-containing protein [Acidobacteriota bacterium]
MTVWLARTDTAARPTPYPTVATTSTVTASTPASGRGKSTRPIVDGEEPRDSSDPGSYFDWWPARGSQLEWIEMTFVKPSSVSEAEVYWFDDTGRGQVRVPKSWRILYKDGETWTPALASGGYGIAKDRWNKVTFSPVTTSALRLEVTMQPEFSAGLQEWRVK